MTLNSLSVHKLDSFKDPVFLFLINLSPAMQVSKTSPKAP